jgi:hypothetical protein
MLRLGAGVRLVQAADDGSVTGVPLAHSGHWPAGQAWLGIVAAEWKGTFVLAGIVVLA